MSVVDKSTTFKIEWQVSNCNSKSHEIELEQGLKVCFGVKTVVFQHVIYLVTKSSQPSIFDIGEVLFSTCCLPDQRKRMNQVSSEGPNSVFSAELTEWKTPLTFTCWISVKISDTLVNYSHLLGDVLLTEQLWTSAKNACLTDVEFHVKNKTFNAHRSVLAARSPVLATLLEKETKSSSITLDDVQPAIFTHFLRFVYTGQLKESAVSNLTELQTLADRYQIETLQKICRQPIQEMNASELTSLILSINYNSVPSKLDTASLFNKPFNRLTHMSPLLVGSELHSTANTSLLPASTTINGPACSASAHDRANIFFSGNPLTPSASSNSDFTFPKFNHPIGSFNFGGNRTPSSANGASPTIPLQTQANKLNGQTSGPGLSGSSTSASRFPAIASTPTTSASTTVQSNVGSTAASGNSSTSTTSVASNSAVFSFKSSSLKQPVDAESLTLKAVVVSAAVSRLRMIFDELLGSVETSIVNDTTEKPLTAPPPSPDHSQPKQFFLLSPPKLKLPSSSPLSPDLPEICFSFPSITQEGRFGKVPLKSPPSRLSWQSNNSFANLNPEILNPESSINKSKQFTIPVSPKGKEQDHEGLVKHHQNNSGRHFVGVPPGTKEAERHHKPLTRSHPTCSGPMIWKKSDPEKNSRTTSL